jgi:hypothetical protein
MFVFGVTKKGRRRSEMKLSEGGWRTDDETEEKEGNPEA